MSIIDKFHDVIGHPFMVFGEDDLPPHVATVGPSRLVALFYVDKFEQRPEWKPFSMKKRLKDGYVKIDDEYYSVSFLKGAIEVLNPSEYGFYEMYFEEVKKKGKVIALKKGNYAVVIAPAYNVSSDNVVEFATILKKAPTSVNVL